MDTSTAPGVYERHGTWYVAGQALVEQALAAPELTVVPAAPVPRLQARMARFSDGPEHEVRRAVVERLLPPAEGLSRPAAQLAAAWSAGAAGPVDVMPLVRAGPVQVLAVALRLPDVRRVADAVAAQPADEAVEELLPGHDPEEAVAVVSILFQARDATAALIAGALLQAGEGAPVEAALRQAPVLSTRRTAAREVRLGGVLLPAGADVRVSLESVPAAFGSGPHACPGAAQARALTEGVLAGLAGWRVVRDQVVAYEPRPNLRLPVRLLLERS